MDRRARSIALGAVFTAISAGILALGAVLPSGWFAVAALASLPVAAAVIERGFALGALVWVVSSLLGLLIAPGSIALWLFAGFFGYYPLIKLRADRMTPLAAWAAKLSAFALAQLGAMTLLAAAFMGYAEKYGKLLTAIAFAVVFVIFDIGYGKLIVIYKTRISKAGKRR